MGTSDQSIKSSIELAMERLAKRDGAVAKLTDAQKAALPRSIAKRRPSWRKWKYWETIGWRKQEKIPKKLSRFRTSSALPGKKSETRPKKKKNAFEKE